MFLSRQSITKPIIIAFLPFKVEITIVDDTNNPPEFDQPVYNITVESPKYVTQPEVLLRLDERVTDDDDGTIGNGELVFTQVSIDPNEGLCKYYKLKLSILSLEHFCCGQANVLFVKH